MSETPSAGIERFFNIRGRRVRVRVHGAGPPVLLINGLGSNVATWSELLNLLEGFEVITFDAPGAGRSQTPRLPYTIARIADTAREILDQLGHEHADVLGYSLGGAVAQQLALQAPDRVRRLVLSSSSCGAGSIPGSVRALIAVMTPARHYAKAGHRIAMKMVNLAPAEKTSVFVREQAADWHHEAAPSPVGYMLQMTAFSGFRSLPWLHKITHPTLVLSGSDDRLMPAANSAILAAYIPNARMRVFEGWGHYILHDHTSGAGATVRDFFAAEDYSASSAWQHARTVTHKEMLEFVRAAPKSAHPAQFANALVRRRYSVRTGRQ
jgi:pimeloyl-ACP methyl ester carboxylesterase